MGAGDALSGGNRLIMVKEMMSLEDFLEAEKVFAQTMDELLRRLNSKGVTLPTSELQIVDVGAGEMPYGRALEEWARKQYETVRIVAVDPIYASVPLFVPFNQFNPFSRTGNIEKLPSCVEQAAPLLKEMGFSRIGMITLFNPNTFAPLPRIKELGDLAKGVPVVGSISDGINANKRFGEWLSGQGYAYELFQNPASRSFDMVRAFGRNYEVLFVAQPKS